MKRFLFGLIIAATFSVQAETYLYWMIDTAAARSAGFDYKAAKLVASQSSTWSWAADANYLSPYGSDGAVSVTKQQIADADGMGDGFYSALGSDTTGRTYFIELLADSGSVLAYSEGLSYASASSYLSSLTQFDPGASSLWTASTFTTAPIPEPTSGMMLLLGVAALALRRRRA